MNPKNGRIVRRLRAKKDCDWEVKEDLLQPKRTVFSPFFCCDNLIKWNIKCVIFWVKKETKKAKKCFNIVEVSIKGILMFVNENERNRVVNKPINSKIKLKTNTIYNVIGVFFDNFALLIVLESRKKIEFLNDNNESICRKNKQKTCE